MAGLLSRILSYGPKKKVLTAEQTARSVVVSNISPQTTAATIVIYFQWQRNGGGEIDHAHIPKKGTAVITFESREVSKRVLERSHILEGSQLKLYRFTAQPSEVFQQVEARVNFSKLQLTPRETKNILDALKNNTEVAHHKESTDDILCGTFSQIEAAHKHLQFHIKVHKDVFEVVSAELCLEFGGYLSREQTKNLLNEIAAETGVTWIESSENFTLSGTFKQVEESRACLQRGVHQSNGIVVLNEMKREAHRSQSRENSKSQLVDQVENEESVNSNSSGTPRKAATGELESVKYLTKEAGLTEVDNEVRQLSIGSAEQEERIQTELAQMRRSLDYEMRKMRDQESKEKEETVDELERTLRQERQEKTRVEAELKQGRIACTELEERLKTEQLKRQNLQQRLVALAEERDNLQLRIEEEMHLRKTTGQELKAKERTVDKLEKALRRERQERTRVEAELGQARIAYTELEERLQTEQLSSHSFQQRLEALVEERNNLQLRIEGERNRRLSTAAEGPSAESQGSQSRDWIIQREEIVLCEKFLGRGAWGAVREGTFRGCQIAVKEIHELIMSDYNRKLFKREMSMASRCRHPNLLQFIGATNDESSPLFVTELLDTSLRHVLQQRALNHDEIVCLSLDIAKGLNYLHLSKPVPIMHRDISSANVLLWRRDKSWRAKLSDFGAANFMRQGMTVNPGAIIYSAPEAFTPQQTPKVDVYSFGVLLCEMCIREQPDPRQRHTQIGRVTGALRGLIQRCVERDPEARPTMSEIIRELQQLANPLVKN